MTLDLYQFKNYSSMISSVVGTVDINEEKLEKLIRLGESLKTDIIPLLDASIKYSPKFTLTFKIYLDAVYLGKEYKNSCFNIDVNEERIYINFQTDSDYLHMPIFISIPIEERKV